MGSLEYFACGQTSHGMHRLLRGAEREQRVFPSGVFLYRDRDRRVLFDTGYAPEPWGAGSAAWLYRRLLPPLIPPGATIGERLPPESVTHVVLSHLHPDHVGGLTAFPDAEVVLSEGIARTLAAPRLSQGVFRRLLPPDLLDRARVVADSEFVDDPVTGLRTADLFDDDSYQLVDLPGHARGHVGALVDGRVLLAGDAAWGRSLLGEEHRLKPVPRAVADDAAAQAATALALLAAERRGVRLLFSHDRHREGVDLMQGGA
ncbi:MBL fold metallo-hydrolase [Frondihabitans australicus]|uniref:Metallo-beta-lactamase superfamily protein n=1 Tax=Frondihabitans australicus TaxID=386892 RepID=A0A495IJH1_9MICO|nr:MBL fold metallo-hydrolase [Frondihabitans australicus]RKR75276.1 metallo-beta-lactamase superfamily protein [Frondihabitans australicus]